MKKLLFTCLLALLAIPLAAQQSKADSLMNVLNTQKLTPKEQISLYRRIALFYSANDTDKSIAYGEKGLALAEKEGDELEASKLSHIIGMTYDVKSSYDTALVYLERSLVLAIASKDKQREGAVYSQIGTSYMRQEKFTLSIEYYMKSIAIFEAIGGKDACGEEFCNIGIIHHTLKNNERALYYLEQAKPIAEERTDPYLAMGVYHALGAVYLDLGEYDKAIEYAQKALAISQATGNSQFEITSINGLVIIYTTLKDYDKALMYSSEGIRLAEKFNAPKFIVGMWNAQANIFREQMRYKECEAAALKGWKIDSTSLEGATSLALNITLANIFLGNKDKAVAFFWKYYTLKDQYSNKNSYEALMEMEVKYETERKEIRIAALEEEKKLYTWLGIAGGAVLLLAIGLLLIRHRLSVQKRKLAEQQVTQLEQEQQLVATQSVLDGETAERSRLARDLHDGLGGMLSVVKLNLKDMKSYSIMDSPDVGRFDKALEMLDESIGELRRVAHHMMPESLMRYGLKTSLEDFCKAIPGAHFQYLGSNNRLDSRLEVLLYRCTYELVNNAVKYANATSINVQLMADEGLVSLTVHDNGVGFDINTITSGSGLENIRTRVAAYSGKMNIYSSPNKGTEVNIEIESNPVG